MFRSHYYFPTFSLKKKTIHKKLSFFDQPTKFYSPFYDQTSHTLLLCRNKTRHNRKERKSINEWRVNPKSVPLPLYLDPEALDYTRFSATRFVVCTVYHFKEKSSFMWMVGWGRQGRVIIKTRILLTQTVQPY